VQQRHEFTLEPLNSYQLIFNNDAAATAYVESLQRLQRLGNFKLDNEAEDRSWQANVDSDLKSEPNADPEADLRTNTIAPFTLRGMRMYLNSQEPSTDIRPAWTRRLQKRLRLPSELDRPPLVLLDVYPPSGFNFDVGKVIERELGEVWKVHALVNLRTLLLHDKRPKAPDRTVHRDMMVRGRHIVRFDSMDEARRFHRHWNNRVVSWEAENFDGETDQDHVVYTSILEW
jgi:hypothetical protein